MDNFEAAKAALAERFNSFVFNLEKESAAAMSSVPSETDKGRLEICRKILLHQLRCVHQVHDVRIIYTAGSHDSPETLMNRAGVQLCLWTQMDKAVEFQWARTLHVTVSPELVKMGDQAYTCWLDGVGYLAALHARVFAERVPWDRNRRAVEGAIDEIWTGFQCGRQMDLIAINKRTRQEWWHELAGAGHLLEAVSKP